MDTAIAAKNCRNFIEEAKIPDSHPEFGKDHLHYMVDEIESGRVSGEKSHRWLGYLQGILVAGGACTLEEMKQTNLNA